MNQHEHGVRKEVKLQPEIIQKLEQLAAKKKWKLRIYMEEVLINDSKKADKK